MKYRSLRTSVQHALVAFVAILLAVAFGILLLGGQMFSALYLSLRDQSEVSDYFEDLAVLQAGLLDQMADASPEARASSRAELDALRTLAGRLDLRIGDPRFTDLFYMTEQYAARAEDYLAEEERTGWASVERYQTAARVETLIQTRYAPLTRAKEEIGLARAVQFAHAWQMQTLGILACTALLGWALFAAGTAFIQRTIAPIVALTEYAQRFGEGDRKPAEPLEAALQNNETRVLAGAFQQMAETIRRQMGELEEKIAVDERLHSLEMQNMQMQVSLKETELLFQQALINPHFLFNCLNTLSGLAYLEKAPKTRQASGQIAHFLRQALSRIGRSVTLAEELEHVRLYTEIQALRFGDRIAFSLPEVADSAGVVMPAMLVQPLVENAVSHGVGGYLEGGAVAVTVAVAEGQVRIAVADNGVGMTVENRDRVVGELDRPACGGEALGLRSVAARLRAVYGDEAALTIESAPGRTVVTMRFPTTAAK